MTPERAQELLVAERSRIERSLADLGEPVGADELSNLDNPADQGTVLYERELEEGLLAQLRRELEALERAEARLAEGTYGLSVESGEPIPDDRLEALALAEQGLEEGPRPDHAHGQAAGRQERERARPDERPAVTEHPARERPVGIHASMWRTGPDQSGVRREAHRRPRRPGRPVPPGPMGGRKRPRPAHPIVS